MKISAMLFLFISIHSCIAQTKEVVGTTAKNAMVVTANANATKVGIEILEKGGNAIDAAIAVQFALAVCFPNAGNIGGGGFMVLRLNTGETNTLDFREKAPEQSSRDMFIDSTGKVNRSLIETSHLSSGVPGTVDGMWTAHRKYSKLTWKELIQPAIDLAENGFEITERQANDLNTLSYEFDSLNANNFYLRKNSLWKAGDTLIQHDLAETLRRIEQNGRDGFYSGITAELIIKEVTSVNGIITKADLQDYKSVWRKPVVGEYKSYKIISMPPPSSGGIALLQLLKMIEKYPVRRWGYNTIKTIHVMAEAEKRVYADRSQWLGDPDFFDVPEEELLNEKYLSDRMRDFNKRKATPSIEIQAGEPVKYENEETTHFSIVDAYKNAVAVTTTLNDSYGSRIFVTGGGFLLNNEMDDFSAKPGEPNLYGLIGGEANAIEPTKRMLSSMTPTIILKDNKLFMVIGTPGGSTIITSVLQTILNVTEHSMTMQESVNAKRFHHQWLPDKIQCEHNAFDEKVIGKLSRMGYSVEERNSFGRVDAILMRNDGTLEGAADPRGDDKAMGY